MTVNANAKKFLSYVDAHVRVYRYLGVELDLEYEATLKKGTERLGRTKQPITLGELLANYNTDEATQSDLNLFSSEPFGIVHISSFNTDGTILDETINARVGVEALNKFSRGVKPLSYDTLTGAKVIKGELYVNVSELLKYGTFMETVLQQLFDNTFPSLSRKENSLNIEFTIVATGETKVYEFPNSASLRDFFSQEQITMFINTKGDVAFEGLRGRTSGNVCYYPNKFNKKAILRGLYTTSLNILV